jgi:hypothetical protein
MLMLLVGSAHAYVSAPCWGGIALASTLPDWGATGVPVDIRPAVTFEDTCYGEALAVEASLIRDSDGAELAAIAADADALAENHLIELFPDVPLDSEAAYTLIIAPEGDEEVRVGFTTGTTTVNGLTGAATVSLESAWSQDGVLHANIGIVPAADPDTLSILQVRAAALPTQSFLANERSSVGGTIQTPLFWIDSIGVDELCLEVRQIDGAGRATAWSEPSCAEVSAVDACGCATGTPVSCAIGVAVAALLGLRGRSKSGWDSC